MDYNHLLGQNMQRIGLSEAAPVLDKLGLCKAYGPSGRINGPNCYRFGKRDPSSGRWVWDVTELINAARQRGTASPGRIVEIADEFGLSSERVDRDTGTKISLPPRRSRQPSNAPRAELEKDFRDRVRELELLIREHLPARIQPERDRRTLGELVRDAQEARALSKSVLAEISFVNTVRNSLNHPGPDDIADDQLQRAARSASGVGLRLEQTGEHRNSRPQASDIGEPSIDVLVKSRRLPFSSLTKQQVPEAAGLYVIYRDDPDETLYVGIAKSLRFRIMENHLAYKGDDNFVRYLMQEFALNSRSDARAHIKSFCSVRWLEMKESLLRRFERMVIADMHPRLNRG